MNDITLLPFLEFEVRLGKIGTRGFCTDIGKNAFEQIKNVLDPYERKNKTFSEYTDVYYDDIRCTLGTENIIIKKNLLKEDISCDPFDFRVCISQELPAKLKKKQTFERHKKRFTFNTSCWCIDLTEVTCTDSITYECEFEFKDIHYIRTHSFDYLKSSAIEELKNILLCTNI